MTQIKQSNLSRRSFLRTSSALGVAGAAAVTLPSCSGGNSSPKATPTNNLIPPPPIAEAGTWIYEPELFRLTINLGDVTLGNCDIGAESKTFKVRGLFHDAMYWAVQGSDDHLYLQQWTRSPATTSGDPSIVGTYTTPEGYILSLNPDGTTNIQHNGDCTGYGYLGHTALENNIFRQSVASGDPSAEGFILWTRAKEPGNGGVRVDLEIATDAEFDNVLTAGSDYNTDIDFDTVTTQGGNDEDDASHNDHIIKTTVTELEAASVYFYRFVTRNRFDSAGSEFISKTGRAKTLSANDDTPDQLRVALASCSSFPHGYFNAYRQIARHDDLDGVFHLGDYTYEYPGLGGEPTANGNDHDYPDNTDELVRRYSDDNKEETVTLGQYRRRFRNYRDDIDLQLIHTRYWFINTWDDHETTNDSFDPDQAGSAGGAENHNDIASVPEGDWESRKAAAARAYNDWLPITDVTTNSGSFNNPELFRNFRFGKLMNLTILDTRVQGRFPVDVDTDPYAEDNRGNNIVRKFMGDNQRNFMLTQLTDAENAQVTWKLLGQQVMMGHLIGPPLISDEPSSAAADPDWLSVINSDQWDGFDAERETIFDHVNRGATSIDNFIVLTGDIHTSWAIELVDDPRKRTPLPTGPVNAPLPTTERFGVEFVTTSITSPGLDDPGPLRTALETNNQHIRRVDLNNRGYSILELTPTTVNTQGNATNTWYHIESITDQENENVSRAFAYRVLDGEKILTEV